MQNVVALPCAVAHDTSRPQWVSPFILRAAIAETGAEPPALGMFLVLGNEDAQLSIADIEDYGADALNATRLQAMALFVYLCAHHIESSDALIQNTIGYLDDWLKASYLV
jgi:hypothetical protein